MAKRLPTSPPPIGELLPDKVLVEFFFTRAIWQRMDHVRPGLSRCRRFSFDQCRHGLTARFEAPA